MDRSSDGTATGRRTLGRRGVLAALAVLPGVAAVAGLARAGADAVARLRPGAAGRSSEICAQCGHSGHSMLDPSCPATRTVI